MKFKSLTLLPLIIFLSLTSHAQLYKHAAGVRIGPSSPAIKTGLTYKHFLNQKVALEGIVSLTDGFGICGLYEIHNPLTIENLQWLYGAGAYIATREKFSYIGAAGIVGLDYKFPQIPLNITIDWKPELNFVEELYFEGATVGFSARFTF